MPPQEPSLTPSPVIAEQVVTLTVYSSGSSTQSGLPSLSGGGGTTVPVAAIAGGVAGGVAIAVLLVIIWKHWGRVIKRTEKLRRKEVQEVLTMRENTRRNASSGFRPQSQYRPMLTLNPEGRKVTFLTRAPTLQRAAAKNKDVAPSALAQPTEEEGTNGSEGAAPSRDLGPARQGPASLTLTSSPAAAALLVRETAPAVEPVRKSESDEQRAVEVEVESTESMRPRRAPSPTPSSSQSTPKRAPSPTPSRNTSEPTSPPRPSRSVRMRTPKRLPDPPSMPPGSVGRSSSPTPSGSRTDDASSSHSRTPSVSSSRAHETPRSTSPVPTVPPVPPVPPMPPVPPVAGPSSSQPQRHSWVRSPLRNSVLPSDQPVIMPRPKNAQPPPSSGSQPVSPTSTWGHVPSLSGSTGNGEPHGQYLGSMRRGKAPAVNQRTVSTHSSISMYSTDSLGRAEER